MIVYYHPAFNIDLGLLNKLHPFDGSKFRKVYEHIRDIPGLEIRQPASPVSEEDIDEFADALLKLLLRKKKYILRALEVPMLSFLPFSLFEKRILLPMRWGAAATREAAALALQEHSCCWNISGGYHHASRGSAEGFCIYNDVGMAVQSLKKEKLLKENDPILIIDVDAHHGNGNAYTFMDDPGTTLLDIYNKDLYPTDAFSRKRVNVGIPLVSGTKGATYLQELENGLKKLNGKYRMAFVIAGTDVLSSDPLGKLNLSLNDVLERDLLVYNKLSQMSVPAVFLGGGGYSRESAVAIHSSIGNLYNR